MSKLDDRLLIGLHMAGAIHLNSFGRGNSVKFQRTVEQNSNFLQRKPMCLHKCEVDNGK